VSITLTPGGVDFDLDIQSLDNLVEMINQGGWLVTTLNQNQEGTKWMAAVCKPGYHISGYGQADTPVDALLNAWLIRKEPKANERRVLRLVSAANTRYTSLLSVKTEPVRERLSERHLLKRERL